MKLRFRTFTYFYHGAMRLIKNDASFPRAPRVSRLVDFTRGEKNPHDWYPLAWQLAEIGCDCSNIRILQEKLTH